MLIHTGHIEIHHCLKAFQFITFNLPFQSLSSFLFVSILFYIFTNILTTSNNYLSILPKICFDQLFCPKPSPGVFKVHKLSFFIVQYITESLLGDLINNSLSIKNTYIIDMLQLWMINYVPYLQGRSVVHGAIFTSVKARIANGVKSPTHHMRDFKTVARWSLIYHSKPYPVARRWTSMNLNGD